MSRKIDDASIRVILADDHTLFREGMASLLARSEDIELVAGASSGEEAIRLTNELLPEIVLMDIQMPGMGGIEATRTIIRQSPHVGIIILTMFENDASIFAALKAGARGYVLKDADPAALIRAIRAVARGETLLSPSIARRVLEHFSTVPSPPADVPVSSLPALFDPLTTRETEVLQLITGGLRNREIAQRLVISEKTVGNHISNIFAKLQVNDRSQAILRALRLKLVRIDPEE